MDASKDKRKEFKKFDKVFGPHTSQEEIFRDTFELLEKVVNGLNLTIFAYGQTGSGKTFTMAGTPDAPGITPRCIELLFDRVREMEGVSIKTQFLEIYNDQLIDLYWLHDNKKKAGSPPLDIGFDPKKKMVTVTVKGDRTLGATVKTVSEPGELMALFDQANKRRHVAATKMNAESSRSHSIFSIIVEGDGKVGKLSLIDLAGSERGKDRSDGDQLKGGIEINKSLGTEKRSCSSEQEHTVQSRPSRCCCVILGTQDSDVREFSTVDFSCAETIGALEYAEGVQGTETS